MSNPFQVVRDFEAALCEYTGAPYAVTVNSCTMALLLAVAWHLQQRGDVPHMKRSTIELRRAWGASIEDRPEIEIPRRTYVGVPQSIIHAGGRPTFREENWSGAYQLKPLPVWDSARLFTSSMFMNCSVPGCVAPFTNVAGQMLCVSFHWSKTLGIQQGGAILHDSPEADVWLRRARFDGRTEGVAPKDDRFDMIGWHCYMSPEVAAAGLVRLARLPKHNEPLPNDEYPDLSTMEIFR